MCAVTAAINHYYGAIKAIRKHVAADKTLPGRCISVCIDKAAGGGVIVAGLEVIEAGFGVVIVTPVAEGVDLGKFTGSREDIALGVVGVAGDCFILKAGDIPH